MTTDNAHVRNTVIMFKENGMIIRNVELETVCGITSKLPDHILPEIAFAGKSNVGKSSLINALMNRKDRKSVV